MTVVVAGEALVDLVPEAGLLRPLPGGAPFNVAVGLARLGVDTAYVGQLSTDGFGRLQATQLDEEGVDTSLASTTDAPTTLAVVHLDGHGEASYGFYLEGTAAAGLTATSLPTLPDSAALHVSLGAITFDTEPAGTALGALLRRERDMRVRSLDPNVRPAVIDDLQTYRERIESAIGEVEILRFSDADITALYPARDPSEITTGWSQGRDDTGRGPILVVSTRADGVTAWFHGRPIEVGAEPVKVVDTVGAGDTFTAGLLAGLDAIDVLRSPDALAAADPHAVEDALRLGVRAAAVTCTRRGADPPRRREL